MSFCISYLVSIDDLSLPSNPKIAHYLIIFWCSLVQKIIDQPAGQGGSQIKVIDGGQLQLGKLSIFNNIQAYDGSSLWDRTKEQLRFIPASLFQRRSVWEIIFSWVWSEYEDQTGLWCGSPAGPEAPSNDAHRRAPRQPKMGPWIHYNLLLYFPIMDTL